jgi:hypothetical protein
MYCKRCNIEKSIEEFRKKDGPTCISCIREYDRLRKANNKINSKKYYQEHKKEILDKNKTYWETNKNELLQKKLVYYHKNKDIINLSKRQNHNYTKVRYHTTRQSYIKSDRGKLVRYTSDRKRRALKLSNIHPNHNIHIERVLEESRQRLEKCLNIKFHLDHIIPLSKGGLHYHLNMQVIPAMINLKKGNKII